MTSLRVLVGCETSGRVRNAFLALGHDAWSCDLLPSVDGSNRHIVCDVRDLLGDGWDLLAVMHPPCTRLCNSGVRWLHKAPPGRSLEEMWSDLDEGAALFSECWNAPIERVAVETPSCIGMRKNGSAITSRRRRPCSHGGSASPLSRRPASICAGFRHWLPPTGLFRRAPERTSTSSGQKCTVRRHRRTAGKSAR